MFKIALFTGVYSYIILGSGLFGLLEKSNIVAITLLSSSIFLWISKKDLYKIKWRDVFSFRKHPLRFFIIIILFIQALVNLIGALGPELSFDALWYHLTLPKLYIESGKIFHIPGKILYYSSFPRLTEMLYTSALILKNEILAKLIHWVFGVLSGFAIYKLLNRYLSKTYSLLGVLVFYTMPVVGWLSTTAYVDLTRTFFEILGFLYFLKWVEKRNNNLEKSALMMGLSLCTKYLSFQTFIIYVLLIVALAGRNKLRSVFRFGFISIGVALPWYVLSFINTGNPIYPLLTGWFEKSQSGGINNYVQTFSITKFLISPWNMTFQIDNLLTPIFLIVSPLVVYMLWRGKKERAIYCIGLFTILSYIIWFLTPPTTARYILPFTPVYIFLSLWALSKARIEIRRIGTFTIIIVSILHLGARTIVNQKYAPVVLGRESKREFLSRNLNFKFGDFYDIDGYFEKNIRDDDLVLIYGIGKLYYVDFPFVHSSWVKKGTHITYILVKDMDLPQKFGKLNLVYENKSTGIRLYKYDKEYF